MGKCKRRALSAMAAAALLTCIVSPATAAGTSCIVPNSVTLDILPAGCMAFLTNGPITYTGVIDSIGNIHNIEVDQFEFFNLDNVGNSVEVFQQGTDTDVTTSTVTPFAFVTPNIDFYFLTNPTNNDYSPDTGNQTFGIAHFIDYFDPGVGTLKLNFGESGQPNQSNLDTVQSNADDTTSPGNFRISSFFDVFTEITLNGGTNYTVANDDFTVAGGPGSGAQFQIANLTPEPSSAVLFVTGFVGICFARRRKKG